MIFFCILVVCVTETRKKLNVREASGRIGDTKMKNTNLIVSTILAVILLSVTSAFTQDKPMGMKPMPKDGMDMAAMQKDGHHALMMAYHHNAAAFTRALWEMTADGKIEDLNMARVAFAEIKRSIEKMDEIHHMHMSTMGKMDAAMTEKMKPMMEKMESEKASVKVHVQALESSVQGTSPRAQDIEMHAAALLLKLERMKKPEMKMAM
jgi:heme/copper-type cytochrome/quinol oxidase subunit 2